MGRKGQQSTQTLLIKGGQRVRRQTYWASVSPTYKEIVWTLEIKTGVEDLQAIIRQYGRHLQKNFPFREEKPPTQS